MKTCSSTHRRPFDPGTVHCSLIPSHTDSHFARYVTLDGRPGLIYWRNE